MHRSFTLAINGIPWECIPQMDGAVTGVLRFNKYNLLNNPLFYIKNEANVRVDDILGTQDITDIDIGPINCPDNKTLNQLMLWSADKIGSKGLRSGIVMTTALRLACNQVLGFFLASSAVVTDQ